MKKLVVKLLLVVFSLSVFLTAAVGCGGNGLETGDNILNIGYYKGGYGTMWMRKMAEDFESENPGVKVNVDPDPYIVGNIPRYLEKDAGYDMFFSHGIEWEYSANKGWLEPLDDVYATEVEPGVTVLDRVPDHFIENSKFKAIGAGDTEEKFYKMHWTNGVGGIVYNKKMFEENGWEIPKTYDELSALCAEIVADKVPTSPGSDERIKPFVFSKEDYYWDYLVFDWMLQLCGVEAYEEFLKLESAENFNPATSVVVKAQQEALQRWTDLIAKNPNYSMYNSIGKEYILAQNDFVNGNAAMMPNAQWLENEMLASIDEDVCVMAMMPTPTLPNAKTDPTTGEVLRYSRSVGGDDSIVIPKKAPNKALAKKFLVFMSMEENALKFTQNTHGVMLGVKYDGAKLNTLEDSTEFMKTVFEINTNSIKYVTYSPSVLRLNGKIKAEWFTTNGFAPYPNVIKTPNMDVSKIFTDYYSLVKGSWSSWGGK